METTILVLTDFSETAAAAARYAASLTHQLHTAKMILYHSYEFVPVSPALVMPGANELNVLKDESLQKLKELKDSLLPLCNSQTLIDIVANEDSLLGAAEALVEQHRAGLIVMGTTGKSSIEDTLMGSNAIEMAREISSPLLLIPLQAIYERIDRVALAVDLENVARTTPEIKIKKILNALGAMLYLLNVDHKESNYASSDLIAEQTAMHDLWDEEGAEYYFTDNKDIAEGIADFVNEHRIQLVMAVPKKRGFFESVFHRSVTRKLAFHTHIPLMLFQSKD